jgi:acetylglutamate kinase
MATLTVLKFGGELLDDDAAMAVAAQAIVRLSAGGALIVVHGGGRAIDAELRARGQSPAFVDGLRITDRAALDAVVSVLAGRTNTALVAAVGVAGGRAVGLTGADGRIGIASLAPPLQTLDGRVVDLGLVGNPAAGDPRLLLDLVRGGYIPIVASIGVGADGALLNVNADVLAGHLAEIAGADRLMIAGTTPGVLDGDGRPLATLAIEDIDALAASGTAHSGMIAKLQACRRALLGGVDDVLVASGRGSGALEQAPGTRIVRRGARSLTHAEMQV